MTDKNEIQPHQFWRNPASTYGIQGRMGPRNSLGMGKKSKDIKFSNIAQRFPNSQTFALTNQIFQLLIEMYTKGLASYQITLNNLLLLLSYPVQHFVIALHKVYNNSSVDENRAKAASCGNFITDVSGQPIGPIFKGQET